MALDKLIDSAELDANLTAVADAIRSKGSTTEQLSFPDGFVSAVEGIQAGDGADTGLEALIVGTLTDLYSETESVYANVFYTNQSIVNVTLPNCFSFGNNAFAECPKLVKVSLPKMETVNYRAFRSCGNLSDVYLPKATNYGSSAFQGTKITKIPNMENVAIIDGQAFYGCPLTEVTLPNITFLGDAAFQNCNKLVKADLGSGLTDVSDRINMALFQNCTVLETVILRKQTMHSLRNIGSFSNTPIANGTGYIYVPSALVDSYKEATNWATYATQFRAIEDYPEICGEVSA